MIVAANCCNAIDSWCSGNCCCLEAAMTRPAAACPIAEAVAEAIEVVFIVVVRCVLLGASATIAVPVFESITITEEELLLSM